MVGTAMPEDKDPSLAHLVGRLAAAEELVTAAVQARRSGDPAPEDRFRGLYFSDAELDRLLRFGEPRPARGQAGQARLEAVEAAADAAEAEGADLRLRRLARTAGLSPLDVELLVLILAPDVEARFERLYAYLNDDVGRRRATPGLVLELCGLPPVLWAARERLGAGGPLVRAGLVEVREPDRPFLGRPLVVCDRVVAHLLGGEEPDPLLEPLTIDPGACLDGDPAALARAIERGARLVYVRERPMASGAALAAAGFRALGLGTLVLDAHRLGERADVAAVARAALREARLRAVGLVAGPVEALAERGGAGAVRAFAEVDWPVALTGAGSWDAEWAREAPLMLQVDPPHVEQRSRLWRAALNGSGDDEHLLAATAAYKLGGEEIVRAVAAAELHAAYEDAPLDVRHVRQGARAQGIGGLERLAHRIEPSLGWDDIVLPPVPMALLRELAARVSLRPTVLETWGMKRGGRRGEGIAALFAGPSGTGKTMAAEVIAGEIGFDLYAVNLATVVDKYIGETEKNLDRIFNEAERVNGVLFFDEADALFGKRSEVRDAHDRYANVEVAYLLQRMEAFDGIVILATNLRSNVDPAFARRLDALVDFPMPDAPHRRRIWDQALVAGVPREASLDLDFCASAFELAGGNIRNIALAAAYLAATQERAVGTPDLIRATEREFRKLGRLCVESDFGPYYHLIS
jgi:hypothetical protein